MCTLPNDAQRRTQGSVENAAGFSDAIIDLNQHLTPAPAIVAGPLVAFAARITRDEGIQPKGQNMQPITRMSLCLAIAVSGPCYADNCSDVLYLARYWSNVRQYSHEYFHYLSTEHALHSRSTNAEGAGRYGVIAGDAAYAERELRMYSRLDQRTRRILGASEYRLSFVPPEAVKAWRDCMGSSEAGRPRLILETDPNQDRRKFVFSVDWDPPYVPGTEPLSLTNCTITAHFERIGATEAEDGEPQVEVLLAAQSLPPTGRHFNVERPSPDHEIRLTIEGEWGSSVVRDTLAIPPYVQLPTRLAQNPMYLTKSMVSRDQRDRHRQSSLDGLEVIASDDAQEPNRLSEILHYARGLYMHPGKENERGWVEIEVPPGATHFRAIVGFRKKESGSFGNVQVSVSRYVDGAVEAQPAFSAHLENTKNLERVYVSLNGSKRIRLAIDPRGTRWNDGIVWADARFVEEYE